MRSQPGRRCRPSRIALGAALALAGCGGPTEIAWGDLRAELERHRAAWVAHDIAAYQHDYLVSGFLVSYAGKRIRIVVRDGVVQSATSVETGQPLPCPLSQWPTVDRLFEQGLRAVDEGALRGAQFDDRLDYPVELDLAGPPDASGSIVATSLQPLP